MYSARADDFQFAPKSIASKVFSDGLHQNGSEKLYSYAAHGKKKVAAT
jgi:hypothetical protein